MRRWVLAAGAVFVAAASPAPAQAKPVAEPRLMKNIATGETGWFSSPSLADLDGDRRLEIVAPFYSTFAFSAKGRLLGKATATRGRVYAPSVVADLDRDGVREVVVGGNEGTVAAYSLQGGRLELEPGWPASTCSGGQCPETRGLAAGDLDGDGRVEVIATTTNTSPTGSQVFAFDAAGAPVPGWPRYNQGSDPDFNGVGNHGYGAYGENVGIGQLDGDRQLEVVATFDNHQINLFNHDGTSVLASPWYRNRQSGYAGRRLGWGQFIRWLSARVEDDHMYRHTGPWPDVRTTAWLQWTASPPSIADLNRDGRNEVIGLPNVERGIPYETQAYAFMALDGAYGSGSRSGRRHKGFRRLPLSRKPVVRPDGDWYPPSGIPAPSIVNLRAIGGPRSSRRSPTGPCTRSARAGGGSGDTTTRAGRGRRSRPRSSPPTSTATAGSSSSSAPTARLAAQVASSSFRHRQAPPRIRLRNQRDNGNGVGIAAAPSIADLDRDRRLEIVVSTFDHGIDVYRVARSRPNRLAWPTGRGSPLRAGVPRG